MADKKKAPARSAKSTAAAGKKVGRKLTAAKKPGRPEAKLVAKKPVGKAHSPIKGKKPVAKTAGTAAGVKPVAKPLQKPVAHKPAVAAPVRAVAAAMKPSGQKITAPVPQQMTPKAVAEKAAAARQLMTAQKKPVNQRHGFKASEFVVYPAHGVGKIVAIEEQEIAGMALELFVINFEKEKLTLRVPTGKLASVGMRKLAEEPVVKKAMEILKGRARVKRTMWSRRAQEYVAKINSGDLVSIAEVVRDLYRSEAQPEQSYSERQLYEDALDRMAREIAAVEKLDERGAVQRITEVLSKSARGRRLAAEAEGGDAETRAALAGRESQIESARWRWFRAFFFVGRGYGSLTSACGGSGGRRRATGEPLAGDSDLARVLDVDVGSVAILDPAAHLDALAFEAAEDLLQLGIGAQHPRLDAGGEVPPPVAAEVDISPRLGDRHLGDRAGDDLVRIPPSQEIARRPRGAHRVCGAAPETRGLVAGDTLVVHELAHARVAAGQAVGAGVAGGEHFALHPNALAAVLDKEMRKLAAVSIACAPRGGDRHRATLNERLQCGDGRFLRRPRIGARAEIR
jgi:CarD family transcriptional regulator